jgi:hypothetical protein
VWCDDHLTRSRSATIRTRLQERAKRILLIALATSVGLTPQHLVKVAAMLAVKATTDPPPRQKFWSSARQRHMSLKE